MDEPQAHPQAAPTAPEKPAATAAKAGEVPINTIDRSHAGEPGPAAVEWEMKGGTKQKLSDHKGMKMLVNLWATWCAPCIAEMPALDKLAGEVPVMVLPISEDMEGWQAVDKFWGKDKFKNIETGLDQPGSYAEAIEIRDGHALVPERPGWGFALDPGALRRKDQSLRRREARIAEREKNAKNLSFLSASIGHF